MKIKKYSFIFYNKEKNKQNLKCINFLNYDQAKKELDLSLNSLNLKEDNAEIKEVGEDNIKLVFNSGSIILKICPFVI